jgi:dissimilatory sulfite reductase related protein
MTADILDTLEFDEEGYMIDATVWTEEIGRALADEEEINLTERHWVVINFARKVYAEEGDAPTLRSITKKTDVSMKEIYKLFPDGPAKQAAMVAGLPKPTGCI